MSLADQNQDYEVIVVCRPAPDHYRQVKTIPVRLNQVGGGKVINPESLITQIEDAIYVDRNTD